MTFPAQSILWGMEPGRRRAARCAAALGLALAAALAAGPAVAAEVLPVGPPLVAAPVLPERSEAELAALPAPARRRVVELERVIAAGLARLPEVDAAELAGGFMVLGQLYRAYDLDGPAEQALDGALALAPGDADLLHRRGLTRLERGRFGPAAEDFRAVVAAQPQRIGAWLHLGEALLALERPAEAREAFAAAEALGARATGAYGLGRAALAAGEAAQAVEHLQAAISLQPSATVAHADLARALERVGEAERAARHRAQAGGGRFDDHDPVAGEVERLRATTSFDAVRELAAGGSDFEEEAFLDFVVAELGPTPGAADRLRAELAEHAAAPPSHRARLHLALGGILLFGGHGEEAVQDLSRAVELDPTLRHARLQLAGALARLGRFAEAVPHYDRLLAERPDDPVALTRRAASRLRLGDEAAARADLERAVALAAEPDDRAAAHALLAGIEAAAGNAEAADRHYRQALAADPESRDALRGHGLLLGRLERFREAAAVFGRLVALEPEDAAVRDAEAVALIFAGDEAAARQRLEAAVAELPDDPRLAGRLARLLAAAADQRLRDGARAVELAERVFAAAPTAEAVETLAMAHAEAGDFAQAAVWQRRLLAAEDASAAADRERREANLARYESGRTCCAGQPTTDSGGSR